VILKRARLRGKRVKKENVAWAKLERAPEEASSSDRSRIGRI